MAEVRKSSLPTFRLFQGPYFENHLRASAERLQADIDGLGRDYILNADEPALVTSLVGKYRIAMLELQRSKMTRLPPVETEVNVSGEISRGLREGQEFYVRGTKMIFVLPFTGDPPLFRFTPSDIFPTWGYPYGEVHNQTLHMEYTITDHDVGALQQQLDADIAVTQEWVDRLRKEVDGFNSSLESDVRGRVQGRKNRILADLKFAASFDIPVQERPGEPRTYSVPVHEKLEIRLPEAKVGVAELDPALSAGMYDAILTICDSMSQTMERTPKSYDTLDEEAIRDHFLAPLNGVFGFRAAGETFNRSGKADIVIEHVKGKLFICECKFWKGPKYMREGIDQLLGNVTWRDTKTAVLVFNRAGNMTKVVQKAQDVVKTHPLFKREDAPQGETHFRYVFRHPEDPDREIFVAVLLFDVPAPGADLVLE